MKNKPNFADLHCHTTLRVFHKFSTRKEKKFFRADAHPWTIMPSRKKAKRKGLRAKNYAQSDFVRLQEGGVRLVFATIYPFEQGYTLIDEKDVNGNTHTRFRLGAVASAAMGISPSRLNYLEDPDYNYWEEFIKEHIFICRGSGLLYQAQHIADFEAQNDEIGATLEVGDNDIGAAETIPKTKNRYWIVADNPHNAAQHLKAQDTAYQGNKNYQFQDFDTAQKNLKETNNDMVVVLNVEGAHFLTLNRDTRLKNAKIDRQEIFRRIEILKQLDPPIFYITPAHHFDNLIMSHAKSIPDMTELPPQKRRNLWAIFLKSILKEIQLTPTQKGNLNQMDDLTDKGISALGEEILLELLHLEKQNNLLKTLSKKGRRILIDTKHMSATARRDFYQQIILPYNQDKVLEDRIPVLATHSAYSGVPTLQEMIQGYAKENNTGNPLINKIPSYLSWNINLADEDIRVITQSGGLIGLNFEQRVVGVPYNALRDDFGVGRRAFQKEIAWQKIMAHQIKGMVNAVKADSLHQYTPHGWSIWNVICIGSDFDGGIDPVNNYTTAEHFTDFRQDLIKEINAWTNAEKQDFGLTSPEVIEEIVQKICFKNLYDFFIKHFEKNYFKQEVIA